MLSLRSTALGSKRLRAVERYLYILPALLLVALIVLYPLASNIVNSLQTDDRMMLGDAKPAFVGFQNFARAWQEGQLQRSTINSFLFTSTSVAIAFLMGLLLSSLLNRARKLRVLYRVLIMLPWIVSPLVAAFAWRALFDDAFGFINYALLQLGIIQDNVIWLGSFSTAFAALIVANVWRIFPFVTIMLLAGLQSVPREIEEAAEIDGAGPFVKYFRIILPQMRNIILIIVLLQFIWNFNEFTVIQILTQGGPADSTIVLPVLIHKLGFKYFRTGTASALSLLLSIILLIFSLLYLRVLRGKRGSAA